MEFLICNALKCYLFKFFRLNPKKLRDIFNDLLVILGEDNILAVVVRFNVLLYE